VVSVAKIKVLDEYGELLITLGQLYAALKNGAKLEGHYMVFEGELVEEEVPEVEFCPSNEDIKFIVTSNEDPLSRICSETYKYFRDRCAACAIKVFSVLLNDWVINEDELLKIFEVSKKWDLKLEWRNGSIVLTRCEDSWSKALNIIRRAINELK